MAELDMSWVTEEAHVETEKAEQRDLSDFDI